MPGKPKTSVIDSKTMWAKTIQERSISRGPIAAISQSRTPTGLEVLVHDVADPAVAPAQDRVRRALARQVGLEPVERALGERRAADVGRRPTRTRPRPREVARERGRRPGSVRGRGSRTSSARPGSRAGRRSPATELSCSRRWSSRSRRRASCRRSCTAARPAARPVDPVHQEERRAEHLAGRLEQPDVRHRHVGPLADDPHRVVLVLERVVHEDRELVGGRRDPGDVLAVLALAVLGPVGVEDQRLRAHAVGVDAAVQGDLRVGALPAGPSRASLGQRRARCVASRSVRWSLRSAVGLGHVRSCDVGL